MDFIKTWRAAAERAGKDSLSFGTHPDEEADPGMLI